MAEEVAVVDSNPDEVILAEAARMEDPEAISRAIMRRILEADTPEAVLSQAGTTSARDVLDRPLELLGAKVMRSGFDEGPGAYMLLDVADAATGEKLVVTCGGRNVLAQVFRLKQLDALPKRVKFVEAGQTAQGYRPLWLNAA